MFENQSEDSDAQIGVDTTELTQLTNLTAHLEATVTWEAEPDPALVVTTGPSSWGKAVLTRGNSRQQWLPAW